MKKLQRYDHTKIEKKWQKEWEKKKVYKTLDPIKDQKKAKHKKKFYVLDMFPYPSGEGLHVGHPKGYIATDVVSRMKRMQGFNVLHPMGFDAFGLPAEQYAIKMKTNPAIAVKKNVARYKKQLEILGLDYDWSREVNTTDPKFYKWTQWIFLKLLEKGLAFQSYEPINWCPTCKTGLANEDLEDGKCERCGTPVEKKPMRQWVLKITDYADRLLKDLDANDYIIPSVVDHVNPPRKDKKDVVRKNVHVIVYDPKKEKYLIIRNKKHGWDTVVIGGIEAGENPVDTALRELREETGYVDLEFKRQLGGEVKASYFAKHKDVNRIAFSTCLYFELKSDKRVEYSKEGEDEGNEPMWIDKKDFIPGKMVNSELPYWLERLHVEVTKTDKGIPCFKEVHGHSAWKDGAQIAERNGIVAIVKHWSKDQYIGLKWKKADWQTVILGGIEAGQTAEEAAIAEIREETGYLNPKLMRTLGNVDAKFFHGPKNVNRYGHYTVMYFELADGKKEKITKEEEANHDVFWIDKEKMLKFVSPAAQKYCWQTLFLGEPSRYIELSKPLLDWPESIKDAQRNWIGRSEGAEFDFKIKGSDEKITVFTTRADTLFGVTYIVLAPEHDLLSKLSYENKKEVNDYTEKSKAKTTIERTDAKKVKTGVELKGVKAIHPASGEEVSVWVADYVVTDYGTGAVMAVPGHDERDFDFAEKYKLPIKYVIAEHIEEKDTPIQAGKRDVPRTAVNCYIRNPKDNTYAFLEWKNVHWKGPVTGGIEQGENLIQAALREIKEETGYKNLEFVRELGSPLRVDFYHPPKDENRFATFIGVLFELENEEKDKVGKEENALHEVKWIKEKEVLNFINKGMRFFERILVGKNSAFAAHGLLVNSGKYNDLKSSDAKTKLTEDFGRKVVKYKLRDWVFSRQRYWGEPIPVLHGPNGEVKSLAEKDLPLELPKVTSYEPTGTGESPLAAIDKWMNVKIGKEIWKRESNTMPQWAGSSWYYLRYMDPDNNKQLVDSKKESYWGQTDLYVGGAEHATRHLIYARFWHKFLFDLGVVSTIEPFGRLQSVGLIMAEDGRKMSKRWGNVVNPDEIVATYGADTMRVYEMFMGPFDQAIAWNTQSMIGARRFIERLWNLQHKVVKRQDAEKNKQTILLPQDAEILLHQTIKKVTEDIESLNFNTAISAMMILLNRLEKEEHILCAVFATVLKLIAPFAPHIAEELWNRGGQGSVHTAPWPLYDATKLESDQVTITIQVNGKVRGSMVCGREEDKEAILHKAKAESNVVKWIEGKTIKKEIYVPGKLVSLVVD